MSKPKNTTKVDAPPSRLKKSAKSVKTTRSRRKATPPPPEAIPSPVDEFFASFIRDLAEELEEVRGQTKEEEDMSLLGLSESLTGASPAATEPEPFDSAALEKEMRISFETTMAQAAEPKPGFHGLAALLTPSSERADAPLNTSRQFLQFQLDEVVYGVAIENLVEINRPLPVTPLPNLPLWLLGIANVRGDIVSVLDLRAFFGQLSQEAASYQRMLFIRSAQGDLETLIIVDQVREFYTQDAQATRTVSIAPPFARSYLKGVFEHKEQIVHLLNVEKLLRDSCAWRGESRQAA
jgi:purine-binding chemotaxis protein CheW